MNILNVYAISSLHLKNRIPYLNATLRRIKEYAEEYNINVNLMAINNPDDKYIESNINTYNNRVQYEKETGEKADEDFNNLITQLNIQQISNIEKHREVLKIISESTEGYHLILEDDVLIGDDYIENLKMLLKMLHNNEIDDWDILLMCISSNNDSPNLELIDSIQKYKFLLNKSSYFIKKDTAKQLYDYLEIFKYNLKISISKFLWDNQNTIKAKVLNKHTFLEGSKMGLFPTSVNNTNYLFQNLGYVKITNITKNTDITDEMIEEAENIYEKISHLPGPDIIYMMGILYFKKQNYKKAKECLKEACYKLKNGNGLITKSTDILNNAINIFQYEQDMLNEYKNKTPKY